MGMNAQNLFTSQRVVVRVGAPEDNPEKVIIGYLTCMLALGHNIRDH